MPGSVTNRVKVSAYQQDLEQPNHFTLQKFYRKCQLKTSGFREHFLWNPELQPEQNKHCFNVLGIVKGINVDM